MWRSSLPQPLPAEIIRFVRETIEAFERPGVLFFRQQNKRGKGAFAVVDSQCLTDFRHPSLNHAVTHNHSHLIMAMVSPVVMSDRTAIIFSKTLTNAANRIVIQTT